MTRAQRRSVGRYHPSQYRNRSQTPPPLGPLHDGPVGGEGDLDDAEYNEDHELYWYYGQLAGGAQLWFGKYKGQRLRETSWSYLKWCRNNLTASRLLQRAFDLYTDGAIQFAKENYKDFIVPLGRVYRGKTLRQCRDKPWMLWVQNEARRLPQWKENNAPFFVALEKWLANPRHQEVKRDVGRSLKATEWEDEQALLDPSQYEEDLGDFVGDEEYDEQDLIDADADPDGNLKGFVVRDSASPEPEQDQEKSALELADELLDAQARARRKKRLEEHPRKRRRTHEVIMPEDVASIEGIDREHSEHSDKESDHPSKESEALGECGSNYAHDIDYEPPSTRPLKTPVKRKAKTQCVENSSDEEC